ncbi:MAG: ATP-binding protein [Rhodococcus sp.]|nr:ATP-binding protein [Rhodococcus sp. (in: high G+C Gram-positive bacteria)]
MANAKTIDPDQDQSHPVVELRIRATPDQLPVLRALASTIAIHENFDLDAIADIKLAMDEICTHLIVRSTEDAQLVCRLQSLVGTLRVSVSTTTNELDDFSPHSFGWRVLETLTDSVEISQEPTGGLGYITTMEFSKTNGMYS